MNFLAVMLLAVLAFPLMSGHHIWAAAPRLPLLRPGQELPPLEQCGNPALQADLEQALRRRPSWQSLIATGKLAVGVVDLMHPDQPRFARVNGDTMMYGASLPKIAILLAAHQGFEDGSFWETPQIHADLIEMIRRSDNAAASRTVARIGLRRIETLLLDPRYSFYNPDHGGGLWVGSDYASGAERHPEPLKGLLHAATVTQVCRFYYLLAYGRLVSPERSAQMLKIMAFPDLHDKFVSVLEQAVPPDSLHRKSGTYNVWHSDSVLVWAAEPWRRYILVAMVESEQGEQILRQLVPVVENLLKDQPPR